MVTPRSTALAGMIVLAAASRLMPHPPNFTPIAAMALFGSAQSQRAPTSHEMSPVIACRSKGAPFSSLRSGPGL